MYKYFNALTIMSHYNKSQMSSRDPLKKCYFGFNMTHHVPFRSLCGSVRWPIVRTVSSFVSLLFLCGKMNSSIS